MKAHHRIELIVPFGTLAVLFLLVGDSVNLDKYGTILISANITLAVFAVNLSFIEYQFSPYRALLRQIAPRQLSAAAIVLLMAFVPILVLLIHPGWAIRTAATCIPLVAYSGIVLAQIVQTESNPRTMIARACSNEALKRFLIRWSELIAEQIDSTKAMELSKPGDRPTHESWKRATLPFVADDPFDFLASLGMAAIQSSDIGTYEQTVERILVGTEHVEAFKYSDDFSRNHEVTSALVQFVEGALKRIAVVACENDKSCTFAARFILVCERWILKRAVAGKQTRDATFSVMGMMLFASKRLMVSEPSVALNAVIVARQAAQKGLDTVPAVFQGDSIDSRMFQIGLSSYPNYIKTLGQEAIKASNTNYLYSCLDALGWLGCSAVEKDAYYIGRECLHGLVQLGREVRVAQLECYDSGCFVQPFDHVVERVQSIASWIVKIEEKLRRKWEMVIAEAFSRLMGKTCTVSIAKEDNSDKESISIKVSNEPHKISIASNRAAREIDFSNLEFLKEFRMY